MDYQRLLFAAEVNKIAQEIRASARAAYLAAFEGSAPPFVVAEWDSKYPLSGYYELAYNVIENAAHAVDKIVKERS